MPGLLSMPGIIFITKVHKKQAPSSCSLIEEDTKKGALANAHGDIYPPSGKGKGPTTKHHEQHV